MPPPPPPDLPAPPGAVWYQPGQHDRRLGRIGGLATAISVLLGVIVVGQLVTMLLAGSASDAAEDYLAGLLSEDDFTDDLLPSLGVASIVGFLTIATGIVTMVWMYRVASNHRALGRQVTFGPGWAVGSWFTPPVIWVVPTLFLREHWKAAEPTSPPGTDSWRRAPEPAPVWVWFALFTVAPLVLAFTSGFSVGGQFGGDTEDAAQNLVDAGSTTYLSSIVNIAGAVAFFFVVRGLTARHRRLTGESRS